MDAGAGNILSALLGGGLVIVSNYLSEKMNRSAIRKNVASAFQAEIQGLLAPFFRDSLPRSLGRAISFSESVNANICITIEIPCPDFVVWKGNADRMGELAYPIPMKLVKFYNMYSELYRLAQKANAVGIENEKKSEKAALYDEIITQAEYFLALGCEISELIEKEYKLEWKVDNKEKYEKEVGERKQIYTTMEELDREAEGYFREFFSAQDRNEDVTEEVC